MAPKHTLTESFSRLSLIPAKSLSSGRAIQKINYPAAGWVPSVVGVPSASVLQPRSQVLHTEEQYSWFDNSPEYKRVS